MFCRNIDNDCSHFDSLHSVDFILAHVRSRFCAFFCFCYISSYVLRCFFLFLCGLNLNFSVDDARFNMEFWIPCVICYATCHRNQWGYYWRMVWEKYMGSETAGSISRNEIEKELCCRTKSVLQRIFIIIIIISAVVGGLRVRCRHLLTICDLKNFIVWGKWKISLETDFQAKNKNPFTGGGTSRIPKTYSLLVQ